MKKILIKLVASIFLCLFSLNVFAVTAETMCPTFKEGQLCTSQKPFCGKDCKNTPYCSTSCWPTEQGNAWSGGGVGGNTNLLYCENATYANCHYSGAPYPTGINSDNIALPCKLNEDGKSASCKCKVFTGPNYVNIYGIMNLGVYYETISVCGADGSKCKNISTCPPGGKGDCKGIEAPVCKYIAQQNPNKPEVSFIPGADLISTFGFGMDKDYTKNALKGKKCSNISIAGCMTQPCKYEKGSKEYATCQCPIAHKESVILPQENISCSLPSGYVWE